MRTHRRIRRIAKWAGLFASLGLLVMWLASIPPMRGWIHVTRWLGRYHVAFDLANGRILAADMHSDVDRSAFPQSTNKFFVARQRDQPIQPALLGFVLPKFFQIPVNLPPNMVQISGQVIPPRIGTNLLVLLPLWLPFIALALPTAYLWHRDRRRPTEGHCPNCNYNMTGNISRKCPECGTPTPKSEPAARAPARDVQPK